jgi:hypothetical protein
MNKSRNSTLATLLTCIALQAIAEYNIDDRFVFDLVQGDSDSVNPSTFIPIAWNEHWFSGFGYSQIKTITQDAITGFADSKVSSSTTDRRTRLNFISYQDSISDSMSYSIGADYDFSKIEKTEFGYFHLVSGAVDDYIAFDNRVDIDVSGIDIRGDLTWGKKSDFALARLSMIFAPSNTLDVDQSTDFKPIVPATGTSTSSVKQDPGYLLRLESRFRVFPILNIGLEAGYELLPLKYDVAVFDPTTLNSFTTARIDVHEQTTRVGIRFIFQYETVGNLYPVIGFFNRKVKVEDQVNGFSESTSDNFYTLGITGAF